MLQKPTRISSGLLGSLPSIPSLLIHVCYLVGPKGSIKLFNMDTLLYVGDFRGKFVLSSWCLQLCRCTTFLIQGSKLKLQTSQAHVSREGKSILPVILGHVHIYLWKCHVCCWEFEFFVMGGMVNRIWSI